MEVIIALISVIGLGVILILLAIVILFQIRENKSIFQENIQLLRHCNAKENKIIELELKVVELKREIEEKSFYIVDGKDLKKKREEQKITQKQLANATKVSENYIAMIEQNRVKRVSYEVVKKIQEAIGIFRMERE